MKETFVQQCISILKREDIKKEIKTLIKPIMDLIFSEIYPYVYFILILILFIFFMLLVCLILLIIQIQPKPILHINN